MVSLGPGDTKLLTIKALEVLKDVDAICVPTKSSDNSFKKSLTHKIIQKLFKEQNFQKPLIPVYSPMRFNPEDWENEAKTIMIASKKYEKVAFVTLGDSAIYSSVYYILDIIEKEDEKLYKDSLVIPGVTSFSDASAKIKKPICLGDSGFEVKPLLDYEVPKTTIYMRPKIGMDTSSIDEQGDIVTFENLNFDSEIDEEL
jgi:precorrin-2/cobalt-factor-2 C20-methyltransferase